jgi:hypothetical protein
VAPERPILAAIADAQPVDFSAMAAAQRSCPEVTDMMNSTLCRSQPRQSFQQESSARLCPFNIGRRFSSHYTPYTIAEYGQPAASSPLSSAGYRWPRP